MKWLSQLALPALCVAAPLGLLSCNKVGFDAVSIRPIYGWVDGCTAVSVGGHGFGDDVKVTIGGTDLVNQTLPDKESLDYGYEVTGATPAGAQPGYAEVKVTSGGQEAVVFGDFYYEACPLSAYPESTSPDSGLSAGTTVTMTGCNLMGDYQIKVGTANPVSVSSACSTAQITFSAPDLPANSDSNYPGGYYVAILDSAGNQLLPDPASGCDTTQAVGSAVITSDTGEYDPCSGVPIVSYGGE